MKIEENVIIRKWRLADLLTNRFRFFVKIQPIKRHCQTTCIQFADNSFGYGQDYFLTLPSGSSSAETDTVAKSAAKKINSTLILRGG
jgi:hypothetical protein